MKASSAFRRGVQGARRRCDARVKYLVKLMPDGSVRARSPFCQAWAMKGKMRCRMHGGASTGPKTPEGKARAVAAMVEGRMRWVAQLKAEGRKMHCGRKPGADWVTSGMKKRGEREA